MSRKIFNYDSVILVKETIEEFGYHPDKYGKASAKFIICSCRFCGEPHKIRKGFYNKSGSACHKKCKIKEMKLQKSPFSNPEVREKSKKTNLERYGVEQASSNKEIAEKISSSKSTEKYKEKVKKTILKKYGVENVFQSEIIKEKIRDTNINRYGKSHPMQNSDVRKRTEETIKKRFGVKNPMQNKDVQKKAQDTNLERYGATNPMSSKKISSKTSISLKETIKDNKTGYYHLISVLRGKSFWKKLEEEDISLKDLCIEFDINYGSLTARLLDNEFKDRYYEFYSFPTQQKQKEIRDIISNLGFQTEFNTRKVISPYELDIYIPENKFAIEFNGSYWHSEAVLDVKEARNKHISKTKLCREKGIRLFHIFEYQWETRSKQLLNFIRTILSKNVIKVAGRKCEVSSDECKGFIEANHIQGYGQGTKKYFNLVYEGKVVASMTASKHHRQGADSRSIVLNRLCFDSGVNVQGGSSKLFKYFREWAVGEGYDKIISWSDNCWTEGNIYGVLGFDLVREYDPDYFYWNIKSKKYLSKQSQKKSNSGCPKDITEREWSINKGLFRIYDTGKRLWEYNL